MIRRLALLAGLVAAVLVASALLTGQPTVRTGDDAAHGATIERYDLRSRFVGASMPQVVVRPPGAGPGRPLLVLLHGRGGRREESHATGAFLRALASLGRQAPVVVLPSGDEASYWHARRSGDWTRYVLDEVVPQAVRRLDADVGRVAIGGVSMGGFGAFDVASHRPRAFCAVGGHSAALWEDAGQTADGAFDDAEDFARHDLVGRARRDGRSPWGPARLWLDVGDGDPFRPGVEAFGRALGVPVRVWPGGHEGTYWDAHFRDYLRFYASALARCRPPNG